MFIDSHIRKVLSRLNVKLGFAANQFVIFKHSDIQGPPIKAYRSNASLQCIKAHNSWMSDCVLTCIQENQNSGREIAKTFVHIVHDA